MRKRRLTVGLAIAGTVVGMVGAMIQPAFADYAPTGKDVVGVGSDTLQYLVDFAADGDQLGDPGYNTTGNKFKLINFDATADANARLSYGPNGVGSGACTPGTGPTAGTGNTSGTHTDTPCQQNPTIVLRAGTSPVQRPNGSGAGVKALAADSQHLITFARASACEGPTTGCPGTLSSSFDSIQVGTDPLAMLAATTTNAVPLSAQQLNLIYSCTDTKWSQVGGTSGDTIIPIIPQVGSGTRTTFLADIGLSNLGSCVVTGEENDPTAIAAQSSPADAIEPMSGGRLDLFLGLLSTGAANGVGGYFKDPSCALNNINTSTPAACASSADTITPAVKLITTGTPSDTNPLFDVQRPLYLYFRASDVSASGAWQPGGTTNPVRTLFYNPCPDSPPKAGDGCTAGTGIAAGQEFGPGGAPFFATAAAASDISAAGIVPTYVPQVGGP
jgi:ABC-type phosphate transport system substrate-binding protein